MVKIKLQTFRQKPLSSPTSSEANSPNSTSSKLWDNEDLVMQALRVYGKFPRPQCFNEISRVCKLSNLRKSRYFHEKMMKNNPYEEKIRRLIAEEGENEYPFFKIFFEEYKTKKERQKLMSVEEDNIVSYENGLPDDTPEDVEGLYYDDGVKSETYDVDLDETNGEQETSLLENLEEESSEKNFYCHRNITPLIGTNSQYLENLELKLKILNKEKETMIDYFETFSNVIENLKTEIAEVKESTTAASELPPSSNCHDYTSKFVKKDLKSANLDQLIVKLDESKLLINNLASDVRSFERDQAMLKEDIKLTTNYAHVENTKLQEELNACRVKLSVRELQANELKHQLENSLKQSHFSTARNLQLQANACNTRSMFNEVRENMDRLFAQIQGLN